MNESHLQTLAELEVCCRAWEPNVRILGNVRAGDAASALMHLRARVAELESMYEAACESWGEASDREQKTFESLLEPTAQIAAHERVCAGTWVPVGERLPDRVWVGSGYRSDNGVTNWITYIDGDWVMDADGRYIAPPTHWLDAKLPASSGEPS